MRHLIVIASLLVLTQGCHRSPDSKPAAKGPSPEEIQARLARISEAALAAKKSGETSAMPWESLATMLPDTLGQLTAIGPATGHLDTTGTLISKAKRAYVANGQTAKVELMDVTHAPSVLLAFMLQRGAVQQPPTPDADGMITQSATVVGYPALTRFAAATQESIVTTVVAQRFVVELRLTPSKTVDPAMQIIGALPITSIATLAAANVGPASAVIAPAPTSKPVIDDDDDPDQPSR